ncbi:DEAD/DEAH box helicase family protein [Apilactobacillus apisilvae]|uniref:DEAD/DEAH box helicase family protein n=1 Tax=Apilactobacillus apisilvae TaxID=2923364 RepID=A0ABY4PHX6_9LACO|nr:helicase-related protein [Apilactobacillus apisilvae]UQS85071.1 DEAD/DEAH box helicase family protein [Apilactobacillus apisilvae]
MIKTLEDLYGRQIDEYDIDQSIKKYSKIKQYTPIKINNNHIYCKRCGQTSDKDSSYLPNNQYYCPLCINLGRVSSDHKLYYLSEPNNFEKIEDILTWDGNLTDLQIECSKKIIDVFHNNEKHLLWAVTGAGKTEMLFSGIESAINDKKRICIASPRVDVCIELFPRIKAAFNNIDMILLHGRQTEEYRYCQLTVCTTHQLLRFYNAFDVLIIDEVDSFPYVADEGLHFAANNACKEKSSTLYLTATPTDNLLKLVNNKQLSISYLPLRFHRHLLPEIKNKFIGDWRMKLKKDKLPKKLINLIKNRVEQKQRFLLFVPRVQDLMPISKALERYFNTSLWDTVHSTDEKRLAKVQRMRNNEVLFLITTTILERGVTFPGIDVIVLGAEDDLFSTSALVQIAGRVGRKNERPYGDVIFLSHYYTNVIKKAIKQIKYMNKLGRKLL